jgi:hypothetical protein
MVAAVLSLGFAFAGCSGGDPQWHPTQGASISQLILPAKSTNGLPLRRGAFRAALVPACAACAEKNLSSAWVQHAAKCDLVIVFDSEDLVRAHYPKLVATGKRIGCEPLPEGIPIQLEQFAPAIVAVDERGQVKSYDSL